MCVSYVCVVAAIKAADKASNISICSPSAYYYTCVSYCYISVSHTTKQAINAADNCQKGPPRRYTTICVSYYYTSVMRTTKQVAAINAADIC